MNNQQNVLILGYGEMGHAMEYLLKSRHRLFIWDKFPTDNFQPVQLDKTVAIADVILFCLPVNPHREIVNIVRQQLTPGTLCLSIAKGLDESGQTAAQIFADELPSEDYALMYGPMISEEIRAGHPAFAQLGCNNEKSFKVIQSLYQGSRLYLEHSTDITGISWSVVLKNVYAMLFGLADELELGDNMRGYLAVASLHELDQIVRLMGGSASSPFHLAGLGDLITTATSEDSHHHELGRRLARGEKKDISGEGVHTLQMVTKHRLFDISKFPLFMLIHTVLQSPGRIENPFEDYLRTVFE